MMSGILVVRVARPGAGFSVYGGSHFSKHAISWVYSVAGMLALCLFVMLASRPCIFFVS